MLDVKTMFFSMIATSIVLAASLIIALGNRLHDGLGKWALSLCLQGLMFGLLLARGHIPEFFSVVLPNALFMLGITLHASALLEFYGRRLSIWWHVIPALVMLFCFSALINAFAARNIFHGIVYGSALMGLGVIANRLHDGDKQSARWLIAGGYLMTAIALYVRAIALLLNPTSYNNLFAPDILLNVGYFVGNSVILMTSVGFLVLHKDRAEQYAQRLAMTDPLTGTFNRRIFLELAEKEVARSRRSGTPLSIIMLDLDHFKIVNDEHGHLAGDAVLKQFAQIVLGCLRREDLLVRYGGEEFCVLLPDVEIDRAQGLAERIRHAVSKNSFNHPQSAGKTIRITVSCGVAGLAREEKRKDQHKAEQNLGQSRAKNKADTFEDAEAVLHLVGLADEMLYAAKTAGRNRVVAYPENSTFAMIKRTHMAAQRGAQNIQNAART